jgi:hypothetical protein
MHPLTVITSLCLAGLLLACGGRSGKNDPDLEEAGKIHLQASEIQEALEPQMDSLAALRAKLLARNTEAATRAVTDIDSVVKRFENWEANLVDVPGLEHEHEHGEDEQHHHHHHDHHHEAPQVTSAEMIDIQKELKRSIEQINDQVQAVTRNGKNLIVQP